MCLCLCRRKAPPPPPPLIIRRRVVPPPPPPPLIAAAATISPPSENTANVEGTATPSVDILHGIEHTLVEEVGGDAAEEDDDEHVGAGPASGVRRGRRPRRSRRVHGRPSAARLGGCDGGREAASAASGTWGPTPSTATMRAVPSAASVGGKRRPAPVLGNASFAAPLVRPNTFKIESDTAVEDL